MVKLVNGKLTNLKLLEGFVGLGGEKVGKSGYIEDKFGIEHEVVAVNVENGLMEAVLYGGHVAYMKHKNGKLLEAKKSKTGLLEGISVGSGNSIIARVPATNNQTAIRVSSVEDENFDTVMQKIEASLGRVAAKALRTMIEDTKIGSITIGSGNGILIEGKHQSSVVIKGRKATVLQKGKVAEVALLEGKDKMMLDKCVGTLLADYAIRRK